MNVESNTSKNTGASQRIFLATLVIFLISILLMMLLVVSSALNWGIDSRSLPFFIILLGISAAITDQIYVRFFAGRKNLDPNINT